MKSISRKFMLIYNLYNTCVDHKEHCGHNCNVSLMLIKEAAKEIHKTLDDDTEVIEAAKLIQDFPVY